MKKELSTNQRKVFEYVSAYNEMHKKKPELRKIGEHVGISESYAHELLKVIEEKGWIELDKLVILK